MATVMMVSYDYGDGISDGIGDGIGDGGDGTTTGINNNNNNNSNSRYLSYRRLRKGKTSLDYIIS